MKKKLVILLCLLAAGIMCRVMLWPEYGSGYSEDQRRLWNERRKIYPVSWVIGGTGPRIILGFPCRDVPDLTGRTDKKELELLMKEKQEKDMELAAELEANRDRSGADCKVAEPLSADLSRLPLHGLTRAEVADRALAGDGDACLMMAQYQLEHYADVLNMISWRSKYEANKWLDKAIALERPGAEFLKTIMEEYEVFLNSRIASNGVICIGDKFEVKKKPGYAEFVEYLKKGDYFAYKTLSKILPSELLTEENDLIYKALLRESEQGRVDCQRDLALLIFEKEEFTSCIDKIASDVRDRRKKWENSVKWLPDSWRNNMVKGLFACGIIGAERTQYMKRYREATRYAYKAARQGDLTGKYLWLRCGITCMERYSVAEWNDIPKYGQTLYEAGYAPYWERTGIHNRMNPFVLDDVILRSYYSKKSYVKLWENNGRVSRRMMPGFSVKDSLEEIREKVRIVHLTGGTDDFLKEELTGIDFTSGGLCSSGGLFFSSPKEVREYLVEQVEKWAKEGDLHAVYALAGIYERGIGVSVDLGRAYALYKKALEEVDRYPLFRVHIRHSSEDGHNFEGIHLSHVIRLKMASLVINYPDFPGRNEQEAYDLILELLGNYSVKEYCCFLLGQFHEKGIGRPVDKVTALDFYRKGSQFNHDCQKGVDRLVPPMEKK